MTKKKPTGTKSRQAVHTLQIRLTEKELLERGKRAGDVSGQLSVKNYTLDEIKKKYKGEIDALEKELETLLNTIRSGQEDREVNCNEEFNFDEGVVNVMNGTELVRTRLMQDHERQDSFWNFD